MLSNVIATDDAKLAVGLPVAVAFEAVDESLSIPCNSAGAIAVHVVAAFAGAACRKPRILRTRCM